MKNAKYPQARAIRKQKTKTKIHYRKGWYNLFQKGIKRYTVPSVHVCKSYRLNHKKSKSGSDGSTLTEGGGHVTAKIYIYILKIIRIPLSLGKRKVYNNLIWCSGGNWCELVGLIYGGGGDCSYGAEMKENSAPCKVDIVHTPKQYLVCILSNLYNFFKEANCIMWSSVCGLYTL